MEGLRFFEVLGLASTPMILPSLVVLGAMLALLWVEVDSDGRSEAELVTEVESEEDAPPLVLTPIMPPLLIGFLAISTSFSGALGVRVNFDGELDVKTDDEPDDETTSEVDSTECGIDAA